MRNKLTVIPLILAVNFKVLDLCSDVSDLQASNRTLSEQPHLRKTAEMVHKDARFVPKGKQGAGAEQHGLFENRMQELTALDLALIKITNQECTPSVQEAHVAFGLQLASFQVYLHTMSHDQRDRDKADRKAEGWAIELLKTWYNRPTKYQLSLAVFCALEGLAAKGHLTAEITGNDILTEIRELSLPVHPEVRRVLSHLKLRTPPYALETMRTRQLEGYGQYPRLVRKEDVQRLIPRTGVYNPKLETKYGLNPAPRAAVQQAPPRRRVPPPPPANTAALIRKLEELVSLSRNDDRLVPKGKKGAGEEQHRLLESRRKEQDDLSTLLQQTDRINCTPLVRDGYVIYGQKLAAQHIYMNTMSHDQRDRDIENRAIAEELKELLRRWYNLYTTYQLAVAVFCAVEGLAAKGHIPGEIKGNDILPEIRELGLPVHPDVLGVLRHLKIPTPPFLRRAMEVRQRERYRRYQRLIRKEDVQRLIPRAGAYEAVSKFGMNPAPRAAVQAVPPRQTEPAQAKPTKIPSIVRKRAEPGRVHTGRGGRGTEANRRTSRSPVPVAIWQLGEEIVGARVREASTRQLDRQLRRAQAAYHDIKNRDDAYAVYLAYRLGTQVGVIYTAAHIYMANPEPLLRQIGDPLDRGRARNSVAEAYQLGRENGEFQVHGSGENHTLTTSMAKTCRDIGYHPKFIPRSLLGTELRNPPLARRVVEDLARRYPSLEKYRSQWDSRPSERALTGR
ncbi:MAG: hypothetical protein LBJ77_00215 [Holosporales bacterium]|jgi:hypothetical protein|nr:hypothetical protein [Holosporales bacterium]